MSTENTIPIDPKRCIYVKTDTNSEIYFSNYYLKQVIANIESSFVSTNSSKFNFKDTEFMNHTLIETTNQAGIPGIRDAINALPNVTTSSTLDPNILDLSLYSKLTYTPSSSVGTPGTLNLETTIVEDTIITLKNGTTDIFTNKAQVRQFLKYNGLWINASPERSQFNDRLATTMPAKTAVGGGKKTTTRRRGKTGYNKHRKSNRRR
jgi:hypothetical protein